MSAPRRRKRSVSHVIALGVFLLDAGATCAVLAFCRMSILRGYTGSLPYLTTLIGALQAATAVVLSAYFTKSRAENTRGGITYDMAMDRNGDGEC